MCCEMNNTRPNTLMRSTSVFWFKRPCTLDRSHETESSAAIFLSIDLETLFWAKHEQVRDVSSVSQILVMLRGPRSESYNSATRQSAVSKSLRRISHRKPINTGTSFMKLPTHRNSSVDNELQSKAAFMEHSKDVMKLNRSILYAYW